MISVKEIRSRNRNDSDRDSLTLATAPPCTDVTCRAGDIADAGWGSALGISITETPRETRWILQGRLFGPWVRALDAMWKTSTRTSTGRKRIVVLKEISFVDKDAKDLLRAMSNKGAQFMASGLYIERVLKQLKIGVRKSLSGMIAAFFTALLPNA